MTQGDQDRIVGQAYNRLNVLKHEKTELLRSARVWGMQLEETGKALQRNPESLALSDESDTPANPRFSARIERSVLDAKALTSLLERIRNNEDEIKRNERILSPLL